MDPFLVSIRPFIWFQKFYGVLPFQFNSLNIKRSKWVLIWGLFVNILYAIFFGLLSFGYEYTDILGVGHMNEMLYHVFGVQIFLIFIFAVGSYVSYISRLTSIQKLYERILDHCVYINNDDYRKKAQKLVIYEILGFFFLNISYHALFVTVTFKLKTIDEILLGTLISAALHHYPVFISILFVLQFCNCVLILQALFNFICNELKSQLQSNNPVEGGKFKRINVLIDGEGNISKLIKFHDDLCDICDSLNKYFNINLLISTLSTFTGVLLSSYYAYTFDVIPAPYICDILYHTLSLWFILFSCESLMEKANEVGILVHKLVAETENKKLKEKLILFSVKLLHRKIGFTACGLFPLDYTLIYSIAGLAASYVVVLIQFDKEFNAKPNLPEKKEEDEEETDYSPEIN